MPSYVQIALHDEDYTRDPVWVTRIVLRQSTANDANDAIAAAGEASTRFIANLARESDVVERWLAGVDVLDRTGS